MRYNLSSIFIFINQFDNFVFVVVFLVEEICQFFVLLLIIRNILRIWTTISITLFSINGSVLLTVFAIPFRYRYRLSLKTEANGIIIVFRMFMRKFFITFFDISYKFSHIFDSMEPRVWIFILSFPIDNFDFYIIIIII